MNSYGGKEGCFVLLLPFIQHILISLTVPLAWWNEHWHIKRSGKRLFCCPHMCYYPRDPWAFTCSRVSLCCLPHLCFRPHLFARHTCPLLTPASSSCRKWKVKAWGKAPCHSYSTVKYHLVLVVFFPAFLPLFRIFFFSHLSSSRVFFSTCVVTF